MKRFLAGVVATTLLATVLSACSPNIAEDGFINVGHPAGEGEKISSQIDSAQQSAMGENIAAVAYELERVFALDGVYSQIDISGFPGVTVVTSDSGYIVKGVTESGSAGYRVSGSASISWFNAELSDISELEKEGVVIPEGISQLP